MRAGASFSITASTPGTAVCGGLAGVDRRPQPRRPRPREQLAVTVDLGPSSRACALGAGQIDPDHAARAVLHGLLHQDLVQLQRELAGQAEDQPRAHAVLQAGPIHPAQRRVDDVVEVALPAQVALHRVEAQLDQRDPAGAELLADDLVDRALDGRRRRLNLLGPAGAGCQVVVQRRHLIGLGRHQVAEFPVGLDRQLEPLIVGDRPEDVGRDSRTDVNVKVHQLEAGIQHELKCSSAECRREPAVTCRWRSSGSGGPQLLPGGEGDGRLLRNRDRVAGLRISHHPGRAAALREGAEARVGEPRTLLRLTRVRMK